jgi:hypothetical protein
LTGAGLLCVVLVVVGAAGVVTGLACAAFAGAAGVLELTCAAGPNSLRTSFGAEV